MSACYWLVLTPVIFLFWIRWVEGRSRTTAEEVK